MERGVRLIDACCGRDKLCADAFFRDVVDNRITGLGAIVERQSGLLSPRPFEVRLQPPSRDRWVGPIRKTIGTERQLMTVLDVHASVRRAPAARRGQRDAVRGSGERSDGALPDLGDQQRGVVVAGDDVHAVRSGSGELADRRSAPLRAP